MRPDIIALPASWPKQLFALTLLWQLFLLPAVDAKADPNIVVTDFDHYPFNLNYFPDSDVVLFQDQSAGVVWRSADAGASWAKVDGVDEGKAATLIMHQYDPTRAYILTEGMYHWRTEDRGKTWSTFFTDAELDIFHRGEWLTFHASDPDKIMFYGLDWNSGYYDEVIMYTTDGFATDAKLLRGNTVGCWWAKSSELFTTGDERKDSSRALCIVRGDWSSHKEDYRLLISDNYFSAESSDGVIQEEEPKLNGYAAVQGVINIAAVKKYILVATASKYTDEMALYVTDDTKRWHRAVFPSDHRINQQAYTVLEGTNYSVQIDVMNGRPSNPTGVLLTSNSNGTYFTQAAEHINQNGIGHVDFEKISGIQGIFLINQVSNWEDVEEKGNDVAKKVKTKITFDDGRTFETVRAGDKDIHLHSVTEMNNVGRVFSSPAPGLVMGNGNTGDYLEPYSKADLYVSDDAGRTWLKGLDGPHKYEFGDQGSILLAIPDSKENDVSEIKYSLNHGKEWSKVKLPKDLKIRPWILTTTQDSTSLTFILTAESSDSKYHIIQVDFEGLHEDTCKESDMEDWFARKDDDGNPSCLMGHTQKYHRRKKDAECFIKQEFKDPVPISEPCDCSDADFECDFNFVRKDGKCEKAGPIIPPAGACEKGDPDETFKGTSGWRLVPGNDCKRKNGAQKDEPKEWKCSDAIMAPGSGEASGDINSTRTSLKGNFASFDKHYLEHGDSSSTADETIIMRPVGPGGTSAGDIMITHDHGKSWTTPKQLEGENIWAISSHQYYKDMVFFLTSKGKVIYTVDRGQHFYSFNTPYPPDTSRFASPWSFHPDQKDWLIFHGQSCDGGVCHDIASVSRDRGDNWETLSRFVWRCEFTGSQAYRGYGRPEKQVVCLQREREDNEKENPLNLIYTDDFIEDKGNMKILHRNTRDFATMAEFIVVATENRTADTLHAWASVNGRDYSQAHWPYNFEVDHERLYTVLDSSTHAVNLFVATKGETEDDKSRRFGSILKSNSNGTSYVLSISGVNCDESGYVDFEKMLGIQGVIMVNTVSNPSAVTESKKLQTKISHNDGAEWAFLPPPQKDLDGKSFCQSKSGDENCALHIHGYTERADHGKTYSSESAVGIMFGWGNVGASLGDIKDADTYMTIDAGISWKMVKKGRWSWSFGDQGSIIVLAPREGRTKSVSYTTDEGETWQDYTFSDSEVTITDITTLRSGASRNFLLWGNDGDKLFTVNLDFSGLAGRQCIYDEKNSEKSDYNLWSPKHPKQANDCLFGHKAQYLRKKPGRDCFNGEKLQHLWGFNNCTCTRQDYEWQLDKHGQCQLVPGYQPMSLEQYCSENPNADEYYEPSGYRRIPLTTCSGEGANEMDKTKAVHPCPGKEEEFERKHSTSGVAIFFAIVIPVGLAGAVGWWVWRNWNGKFGQIRLGDQGSTFDSESPVVKYPVIVISAVAAVVAALPLIASSIWRSATSVFERFSGRGGSSYSWLGNGGPRRFTTRDSFARGRADYAIVDEDEGELLGDDSDEDM
ncbi:Vacuolar protein sorting/targeting protein 10 [Pestalotiopsis fici W106-1]|uniref:Vacuolar protein sorting/targeting protein 10 n=1 Tax=Pestalotiopsis fici (strain W106-1 / CGMCC3.15140) TaxID=1229662 RepID=W3XMQ2_PESFW|nr:Vacuolar protein sorting/targeting protein 10 [Pestalotiopsis fici W106-1]ETS86782.1 Vacuolar protein sorting/targeting protein 10 [Pestalotiopsis fici W106-1]